MFCLHCSCLKSPKISVRRIQEWSKILCQINQEILTAFKKESYQLEHSSSNLHIVDKYLLRVFCKLFYLFIYLSIYLFNYSNSIIHSYKINLHRASISRISLKTKFWSIQVAQYLHWQCTWKNVTVLWLLFEWW